MEDNRRIFAQQDLKYQRMTLQLISDFKNQVDKNRVLKLLAEVGRRPQVDCMNLQGFTKAMREIPVYAFVGSHEVVLLMIDWNDKPTDELADEEGFEAAYFDIFSEQVQTFSGGWRLGAREDRLEFSGYLYEVCGGAEWSAAAGVYV